MIQPAATRSFSISQPYIGNFQFSRATASSTVPPTEADRELLPHRVITLSRLPGVFSQAIAACRTDRIRSNRVGNKHEDRLERVKGIEPSYSAWKAAALPLSYTRAGGDMQRIAALGNGTSERLRCHAVAPFWRFLRCRGHLSRHLLATPAAAVSDDTGPKKPFGDRRLSGERTARAPGCGHPRPSPPGRRGRDPPRGRAGASKII